MHRSDRSDSGFFSYLLGVKKVVMVSLIVLSVKKSTARAFTVYFRVFS